MELFQSILHDPILNNGMMRGDDDCGWKTSQSVQKFKHSDLVINRRIAASGTGHTIAQLDLFDNLAIVHARVGDLNCLNFQVKKKKIKAILQKTILYFAI